MSVGTNWRALAAVVRAAATTEGLRARGLLALEGVRLVERALRSGRTPTSALCSERFLASDEARSRELRAELLRAGTDLVAAPEAEFRALVGERTFGDVIALVPAPAPCRLEHALAYAPTVPALVLVAVNVTDPGNCGALVRTAHALSAAAFVAVGHSAPLHPKALRTSMGSALRLPLVEVATFAEAAAEIRSAGGFLVAASAAPPTPALAHLSTGPHSRLLALVVGSEAHGLAAEDVRHCDAALRIDMPAGIDSLSVNAAAAILLHELRRSHTRHAPLS